MSFVKYEQKDQVAAVSYTHLKYFLGLQFVKSVVQYRRKRYDQF